MESKNKKFKNQKMKNEKAKTENRKLEIQFSKNGKTKFRETKKGNSKTKNRKSEKGKMKSEYSNFDVTGLLQNKYMLLYLFLKAGCAEEYKRFTYRDQRRVFGFVLFGKKLIRWSPREERFYVTYRVAFGHDANTYKFTLEELFERVQKQQEIR